MERNTKLTPPLNFSLVHNGIYRSSYPNHRTWSYIDTLNLKSSICLSPSELKDDFRKYCKEKSLILHEIDVGCNQEPFLSMSQDKVIDALKIITGTRNQPCVIFCTTGKARTGCIIALLRRLQGWSLVSIFAEFELYSESEGGVADLQYIERMKLSSNLLNNIT